MTIKCVTVCVLSSSAFTIIARCVKRGCASQTGTAGSVTVGACPGTYALTPRESPYDRTRLRRWTPPNLETELQLRMSTIEALRTQLDTLQLQLYALETENRKLRDVHPERAEIMDMRVATDSRGKRASRPTDQRPQPRTSSGGKRTSVRNALARQWGRANARETRATRGDGDVEIALCPASRRARRGEAALFGATRGAQRRERSEGGADEAIGASRRSSPQNAGGDGTGETAGMFWGGPTQEHQLQQGWISHCSWSTEPEK